MSGKNTIKWIGLIGSILLAGLLISLIWFFQVFTGPGRVMLQADDAFWRSQFTEAEADYRTVLETAKLSGQRVQAYTALCRLYRYQEDFSQALETCQAAVQLSPEDAEARAQLARTHTWMGNNEQAVTEGQQALQLGGENTSAAAFLAEALAVQVDALNADRDFSQPLSIAQYALELDHSNAETYRVLGVVYQLQGDLDAAAENFQQALQLKPDFFAFYIDLGMVESGRDNAGVAFEAFNSALKLYPESEQAFQGRGWTWWSQGEYKKARNDFQQALLLDEQDSISWAGLGWTYYNEGGSEEAIRAFERALSLDPENSNARIGLESLQNEQQIEEGALEQMQAESEAEAEGIFAHAVEAAVQIFALDEGLEVISACSGVLISADGKVLTNGHCIGDPQSGTSFNSQSLVGIAVVKDPISPPQRLYRARTLDVDYALDVALLQVESDWNGNPLPEGLELPYVPEGDSDMLYVGDPVWSLGFPGMGGDTLTITQGVISGFAIQDGLPWIKTDLMTGPGNSGCMVINADGELIGIHSQSWADQGQMSSRLSAERPINAARYMWE